MTVPGLTEVFEFQEPGAQLKQLALAGAGSPPEGLWVSNLSSILPEQLGKFRDPSQLL